MGFHKRYINDDQVIDIYREQGNQGVMDWYTRGVDALILNGEVSEKVEDIVYTNFLTESEKTTCIDRIVGMAAAMKRIRGEKKN